MGMGFIDAFPFSLGSFAILDDLTDCSSETVTYVERRRSSSSQDKNKSKSKQSTTIATRAQTQHTRTPSTHERVTLKQPAAGTGSGAVKGPETARSTTVANLNVKEENVKLRGGTTTIVSAKRSVANETIAKRSTVTAPAAPGREPSRRPRHEKREEDREKTVPKKEEVKQEIKKEEANIEVITSSKETVRSVSRSQLKSRAPSHAPQPSEAETRPDVSVEELRKENKAFRRRTERLEKDLAAYRRHAEHYRDRRRDADREKQNAEERVRELETVVTNMRDSYESELDNLRNQITEYAARVAAAASATQLYAKDITGQTMESVRSKAPSVKKAPSLRELAVQTEPWPVQTPPPRPSAPLPGAAPPTTETTVKVASLLTKLQQRESELITLRLFHEETPQISLDLLTSFVRTLNNEARLLALSMARDVRLSPPWDKAQAWALDTAEPSLGRCLRLLSGIKGADFRQDVTLVRLALQAWIVSCLQRVFEKFLFGLDHTEDEMLRRVFERVQARESPTVAARWRALTRRYARTLASPPIPSSSTSRGGYAAAREHAIHIMEMDILVGAIAILRFAGAELPQGELFQAFRESHGRRISRVVKRATKLASDLAERAPVGCEVFTVHIGDEEGASNGVEHEAGMALCGCMESVDQECRQWIGQTAKTEREGRTTGTRTRTHTRAGTVRNKSKTRSYARTATTRTWADTNIREWDKDSDEDYEDDSDEEEEEEEETEEDEFVETINIDVKPEGGEDGAEHTPAVLCSLGFGLRRVIRPPRHRQSQSQIRATAGAAGESPITAHTETHGHGHRRRTSRHQHQHKTEIETLHGSQTQSDTKSTRTQTFTLTSIAPTSPLTTRRRVSRRSGVDVEVGAGIQEERIREGGVAGDAGETREGAGEAGIQGDGEREGEGEEGREVEVLVKTDVLVSTTVESLRQRIVHQ